MSKPIQEVEKDIYSYINEARRLIPNLPIDISFIWDNSLVIQGNGTGGSLRNPTVLAIGYDPDFKNDRLLDKNLRATVLHECFHVAQGWSDINPKLAPTTLLEDRVMEGAATVFERDFGGTSPLWAQYEDDDTMQKWLVDIQSKKLDPNSEQYLDYKFGKVNSVDWILYKLGTWVADRVLYQNPELRITDLASMRPEKIIRLARFT